MLKKCERSVRQHKLNEQTARQYVLNNLLKYTHTHQKHTSKKIK